jgi:diketogulonate reductase-like aldo/keto reductase
MYRNEELVGKAIVQSGLNREDVFFSTCHLLI